MRTIALEEHFASPGFLDGPGKQLKAQALQFGAAAAKLFEQLRDAGDQRIAEMDAAGIDLQVLSLTSPGTEQLEAGDAVALARESNDFIRDAAKKHYGRFAGFAALPTAVPDQAAKELERVVRDDGFQGALINGHTRGRYLDSQFFWPIFESAEALRVPIYLHPTKPPQAVIDTSYAGYSPVVSDMFAGAGWGWHIETAIHVLRIILGGVFDRFPTVQLIVGHMGETLPFMLQRVDVMPAAMTGLHHPISHYLRKNVNYTFGGFNFTPTFLDLMLQVGVDRILFSTDYPYASMKDARAFLDKLPVCAADREKIAYGNAERLLRLSAVPSSVSL